MSLQHTVSAKLLRIIKSNGISVKCQPLPDGRFKVTFKDKHGFLEAWALEVMLKRSIMAK